MYGGPYPETTCRGVPAPIRELLVTICKSVTALIQNVLVGESRPLSGHCLWERAGLYLDTVRRSVAALIYKLLVGLCWPLSGHCLRTQ